MPYSCLDFKRKKAKAYYDNNKAKVIERVVTNKRLKKLKNEIIAPVEKKREFLNPESETTDYGLHYSIWHRKVVYLNVDVRDYQPPIN